jgi:hypothetical protein
MISLKAQAMLKKAFKADSINFNSKSLIDPDGNG